MNYDKQIETYLANTLHLAIHLSRPSKEQVEKLPMIVTDTFYLMAAEMYGLQVMFVQDKTGRYSPLQLRKMADVIMEKIGLRCIFVFDAIASYNQSRLIKQGVNFIIPGKLMFMPELLIDIRPMRKSFDLESKMPATAQVMVLYHLERQIIVNRTIASISDMLGVSYATCNKALTWLCGHDLISETKVGKQKFISLDMDKWVVWNKALPYMYTPVERVLYHDSKIHYLSGYNALAHYSHLAHTDEIVCEWDAPVPPCFTKEENDVKIEIWRYSPEVLSETGVVDPLSLYLILKDDEDERVSMELDYMLHQVLDNNERIE